jgi:hypothetical protein
MTCLPFQRSEFHYQSYLILREVVGLERDPLSLVSTTEELLQRKSSGSGPHICEYGCRDPSRWPRDTIYRQEVGTNFPDKSRSIGRYSSLAEFKNPTNFNTINCNDISYANDNASMIFID